MVRLVWFIVAIAISIYRKFHRVACLGFRPGAPHDRQQCRGTSAIAVGPFSAMMQELTRLRIGIRSEPCLPIRLRVFRHLFRCRPAFSGCGILLGAGVDARTRIYPPTRLAGVKVAPGKSLPSDYAVFAELKTASATRAICSNAFLSDLSRAIALIP